MKRKREAMIYVIEHLIFELRELTTPSERDGKEDMTEIWKYVQGQIECLSDEESEP
jgi:hypothetical protein